MPGRQDQFRVLIAGGGVAALEAMVALRALAQERVDIELLAPDRDFFYRPLAAAEPFGAGQALRFDIRALATGSGARHRLGSLAAVSARKHMATTAHGESLAYDALILATGARQHIAVPGALTFRGSQDSPAFSRVLAEVLNGDVKTLAFVVPSRVTWPLPLYELALQTATKLAGERVEAELMLLTPEEAPLGVFGPQGSEAVATVLAEKGIELLTGVHADKFDQGLVHLVPGAPVAAERAVALPGLRGIPIAGVPADGTGFVSVDAFGRVQGLDDVYAAGDGTRFPVKQGGLAAQMADAAASAIAAAAGAPVEPIPFDPVLRGLLLTGSEPEYLRAELGGGHHYASAASESALWWPAGKIVARYLSPYLAEHADQAFGAFGQKAVSR
ncbi:MAG TPA: FAD-dependent oxidoreductase [Gaiellaceae bacterium]|nr:FAD-dependent oxidoreductase [Gaiellaceae bacterium]